MMQVKVKGQGMRTFTSFANWLLKVAHTRSKIMREPVCDARHRGLHRQLAPEPKHPRPKASEARQQMARLIKVDVLLRLLDLVRKLVLDDLSRDERSEDSLDDLHDHLGSDTRREKVWRQYEWAALSLKSRAGRHLLRTLTFP